MLKHGVFPTLLFLTVAVCNVASAGERAGPKWMSFTEGLAEAKNTNRKILVDVYTDWCGWCKRMDAQTYADKDVAGYLNKMYVVIKLNAESSKSLMYDGQQYTERELAGAFGISGYPATIFMKSTGEPITLYPGFADAARFKTVLSFIAEDHYLTTKFEEYTAKAE